MIQEALEYLVTTGKQLCSVIDVHSNSDETIKLVNATVSTFKAEPWCWNHKFGSLSGLLSFVNSAHCADRTGVIWVNRNGITVHPSYETNRSDRLALPATFSDAWNALQQLTHSIGQRNLWRLLVTDLAEAMPPTGALLALIQNIKIKSASADEVTIGASGETSQAGASSLMVTYPGKTGASAEARIDVNWLWKGRIWDTFEKEYEVNLRLELVTGPEGLTFTFHPRSIQDVLRQMRLDIVEQVQAKLPKHFTVYEGEL